MEFSTSNEIKERKYIAIKEDTKIENIIDIIQKNLNKIIEFSNNLDFENEEKFFSILKEVFSKFTSEKIDVHISVNNRELFNKYNFFSNNPNLNITIEEDLYPYTQEEYLEENQKLENIIKPIKESNLSPYEKYIAVYNVVKQFKPYKDNDENKSEARELRYILNNEYIVCVGYAKLLKVLLEKVGINSMCLSIYTKEELEEDIDLKTRETNHQRNIIKIDDEKYNIHGIYLADATWDNNMEKDYYDFANLTFDRKKEESHLEKISTYDYLLDFHNLEEFIEKINVYLRKLINKKSSPTEYKKKVINAYRKLYKEIMLCLLTLDYDKYDYFYNKYHKKIMEKITQKFDEDTSKISSMLSNLDKLLLEIEELEEDEELEETATFFPVQTNIEEKTSKPPMTEVPLSEIESIFSAFLTEYATYIIPLANKKISNETLLTAAINVKQEINKYNQEQLNSWKEEFLKNTEHFETIVFPYSYNPNETRINYLESKEEQSKRR